MDLPLIDNLYHIYTDRIKSGYVSSFHQALLSEQIVKTSFDTCATDIAGPFASECWMKAAN